MKSIYRFERKSALEYPSVKHLIQILKFHPALFKEIYTERCINNIYFDTPDYKSLKDNVDGNAQRIKYRIRWYGEMFQVIENPILELKIKSGLLGYKKSFKISPFEMKENFNYSDLIESIKKSELPSDVYVSLMQQKPVLLNRYRRRYYQEKNGIFRVTLDQDLSYFEIKIANNTFLNSYWERKKVIFELKYGEEHDDQASEILRYFPFRISKNSKYVSGMTLIYGVNE
jgi:SPX domain protein involved in polyphosphate accumulation